MRPPDPSDARSDEDLIAAMNRGDASAFEVLYRRHRDAVVGLAARFTADRDEALDVLQETFAYFLGKFPGFTLRARLMTFFYPVVKNTAIRLRERRRRLGAGLDAPDPPAPPPPADPGAARAELASVLAGLPEEQREAVLLRFVDDFTFEEIAGALGIPLGTVKSRLHNAIAALRESPKARKYFDR
jgi:RNA polymerase sigma-70 factor (ECF subfamily)